MEMSNTKTRVNLQKKKKKYLSILFSENAYESLIFFFFAEDKNRPVLRSYSDSE